MKYLALNQRSYSRLVVTLVATFTALWHPANCRIIISTQQHISRVRYMPSRVCLAVSKVDKSKMVEVRIMQFSWYNSPSSMP